MLKDNGLDNPWSLGVFIFTTLRLHARPRQSRHASRRRDAQPTPGPRPGPEVSRGRVLRSSRSGTGEVRNAPARAGRFGSGDAGDGGGWILAADLLRGESELRAGGDRRAR